MHLQLSEMLPRPVSQRWLLPFVLVIGLLAAGCSQTPVSTTPEPVDGALFTPEPPPTFQFEDGVRIATLNTEFLFDGLGNEGQASFPHKGNPEASRQHRDAIAAILRQLDADLVMLQEVEHDRVLRSMLEESLADFGYAVHFVEGTDTFTGQDVALLSRLPIDQVGRTDARAPVGNSNDTYGVSKNMYARLSLGNVPTTLIGLHLLARPTDASREDRREAQAEVIRRLIEEEQAAGRAVIVLGDFNDYDELPDRNANAPITDVLARIKGAGPAPTDDLCNVMAEVPPTERFTSHWDQDDDNLVETDELSAIDHILLSPALCDRVREVVYVQAHDPLAATDHFPVVVNLGL